MLQEVSMIDFMIKKYPDSKIDIIKMLLGNVSISKVLLEALDNNILSMDDVLSANPYQIVLRSVENIKYFTEEEIIKLWNIYIPKNASIEVVVIKNNILNLFKNIPSTEFKMNHFYEEYVSKIDEYFPNDEHEKAYLLNMYSENNAVNDNISKVIYILNDNISLNKASYYKICGDINYSLLSKTAVSKLYSIFFKYIDNNDSYYQNIFSLLKKSFQLGILSYNDLDSLLKDFLYKKRRYVFSVRFYHNLLNYFLDYVEDNKWCEEEIVKTIRGCRSHYFNFKDYSFINNLKSDSEILIALKNRFMLNGRELYIYDYYSDEALDEFFKNLSIVCTDTVTIKSSARLVDYIAKTIMYASKYGIKLSQNSEIFSVFYSYRNGKDYFVRIVEKLNSMVDSYGVNDRVLVNYSIKLKEYNSIDKSKIQSKLFLDKFNAFLVSSFI